MATLIDFENVIIDLDGALMDSNDAQAHAMLDALEARGIKSVDFNAIRRMMGMNGPAILSHVLDADTYIRHASEIIDEQLQIFETRYLETVLPLEGGDSLIGLLHRETKQVGLSSGLPAHIVHKMLATLGLPSSSVKGVVSAEDVPIGKPNPLAIEVCCEKFGFPPQNTLLIGDSPYDVIAADEFLIPTIGLASNAYSRDDLLRTGASWVYQSLDEITEALKEHMPIKAQEEKTREEKA